MAYLKWITAALGILLPGVALADPVTAAVVAGALAGSAAYGAVILGVTVTMAGAIAIGAAVAGLSYYSSKKAMDAAKDAQRLGGAIQGRGQMIRQAITHTRVVYGSVKVAGPVFFMHTTNNDNTLHVCCAVAGHEINSFEETYIEDIAVDSYSGTDFEVSGQYASNVHPSKGFENNYGFSRGSFYTQQFRGTDTQTAQSNLLSECSAVWDSNGVARGVAYFYFQAVFNPDYWPNGVPNVRVIIKGKKIYDPRSGSTSWTDNAALCLLDYLQSSDYGLGVPDSEIDMDSFIAGANLADEIVDLTSTIAQTNCNGTSLGNPVNTGTGFIWMQSPTNFAFRSGDRVQVSTTGTLPSGLSAGVDYYAVAHGSSRIGFATSLANARAGAVIALGSTGSGVLTVTRDGEPRFCFNGTFDTDAQPKSMIGSLLTCQAATLSHTGGKFYLIPASYPTPTQTYDEDDLISGLQVVPKTSRRDRFNVVKGIISDPQANWQAADYPAVESTALIGIDGERFERDLPLEFIISPSMAQRVAKIQLLDNRQEMIVQARMKLTAMKMKIGDVIYLKNERFGFTETTETVSSVDTATDTITMSASTSFRLGDKVEVASTGTLPTGLSASTIYRVIKVTDTTIQLATTFQRAIDGNQIDLTGAGSGTITITRPTKAFRVIEFSMAPENQDGAIYLLCNVTLREADDSVYDYLTSEEVVVDPSANTNLPDPTRQNAAVTAMTLESGSDYLGVSSDGTVISRINATWTGSTSNFVNFYEFSYKRSADTTYTTTVISRDSTSYTFGPVEDGTNYDAKIVAVNNLGMRSSAFTVTNHTAIGKTEAPPDVQSFSVSRLPDGTRRFTFSTANFPADVKAGGGVLIKYSTNLSETWDNMTQIRDIFRASPYETNELSAGTYKFAIKMVDSTGNESTNAVFITATLGNPRIRDAVLYRIEEDLTWPGTKSNAWLTPENTLSSTASQTWADLPSTWDALDDEWASIVNSNTPLQYTSPIIDLGAEFSFTPLITANGQGTPTYLMKTGTAGDGTVTGSFVTPANTTGVRYFQFSVSMGGTDPYITGITTILDGEFVSQDYNDIDLATYTDANFNKIATGHFQIALTNDASAVSQAYITAIQGSGSTALFSNLVNKTSTVNSNPAAEFKIFDSSGTLTDATLDIFLKGPK